MPDECADERSSPGSEVVQDKNSALPALTSPSTPSNRATGSRSTKIGASNHISPQNLSPDVGLKLPGFSSPHEARSVKNSNSRLVKDLAARIALHCPPAHNWQTRRRDLQDTVREQMQSMPAECRRQMPGANDIVVENMRDAWVASTPCVVAARRAKSQEAGRVKQRGVQTRREQIRHEWLAMHEENKRRLERLREARLQAARREHALTRQRFWLSMMWASAAQEILGREVLQARAKRADLARAHDQIVCIQASIRMFLARRRFHRLRAAAMLIQRGVRLFLRMLYVRRRREAALRVLAFLAHAQHSSRATLAFSRVVRCIQTLKAFIRRHCLERDARILVLKLQWHRWEAEHLRRLTTEARVRLQATRPRDGTGRVGARDTAAEDATVADAIKSAVCRQHCSNRAADFVQRWRLRRVRRAELAESHGLDVVRERCFLLGQAPDTHPDYLAAVARVDADLGPPPLLRIIETPATLAKLHRQGCRLQEKRDGVAPVNVKISTGLGPEDLAAGAVE
eukprot:jgi/Ulvmu1/3655/UM017_0069.1